MASPVGSEIFALAALLVLSLAVLLILRYYLPLRTTPAYLLVPIFFALWLPAGIVLLVPIDLASSARTDDVAARGIWLPDRVILVSWRITYWLTFVLTWYVVHPARQPLVERLLLTPERNCRFVLPILAEYSDSGYREFKDKVLYSLRENAQYHAMVFGAGILGLVYVFISYGVSFTSLKGLIMALAYCWGLVLAIYLMGHGLVAIPRRLFRNANPSGRLRRLQAHAPKVYEQMEDAEIKLEDLELQVSELNRRKIGSARDFKDWIEDLADMTNLPESHPRTDAARASGAIDGHNLPTVITEKYLADLTRRLMRARHARSRWADEWNRLLQSAAETQAIIDSGASKRLVFGSSSPSSPFWQRLDFFTPYTRYLFYYHFIPYARMFLGGLLTLASAFIIWSEMVKAVLPSLSVIRLSVVHHWTGDKGQVGFPGQVMAALWILYMCAAALISVTEVKVWRGRALVKRNTAHESAFWYAAQVARLSIPLSYNFMEFLSPDVYTRTTFYAFLGRLINLTPLGKWFDYLFPIFILVPVCATLFRLYGRVRRFFGFGVDIVGDDEEDEDADSHGYGTGSWRDGRALIERELNGASFHHRREAALARAGASNNHNPSGRAAPVLSIPGARRDEATTPFATSPSNGTTLASFSAAAGSGASLRRAIGQPSRAGPAGRAEPPPEDDNFFQSLGHRMKNTIDTIDKPRWLQDIGQGIKKPKWMGGDGDDDDAGGRPSGSRTDSDGIRRWFGGVDDGRIRL